MTGLLRGRLCIRSARVEAESGATKRSPHHFWSLFCASSQKEARPLKNSPRTKQSWSSTVTRKAHGFYTSFTLLCPYSDTVQIVIRRLNFHTLADKGSYPGLSRIGFISANVRLFWLGFEIQFGCILHCDEHFHPGRIERMEIILIFVELWFLTGYS